METHGKEYSKHGMQQDNPGNIDPEETGRPHPAKVINAIDHLDIKESELGRDQGQKPADEHIDHRFSQIDEETAEKYSASNSGKQFDTDDFKRVDERDNQNSTEEWDAEKNRTGRHK
jgi:hypothetical protein